MPHTFRPRFFNWQGNDFPCYDLCFGCATHSLPGQMPLEVTIRDSDGELVDLIKRYVD